jgi:uncharacterized protein (TIGR02246 family)
MENRSDADVQQGMKAFKDAFNKRDAASLARVYTEDAKLMPVNVPLMTGRAGIQSYWQAGFTQGVSQIEKTPVDLQVLGDTAIETSRFVVTIGERKIQGKDMLIWKRDSDGQWRIAADIWNNDRP